MRKVHITGYKGRLGSELVKMGGLPLELDIGDRLSIIRALQKEEPEIIINCAAFTHVDACEDKDVYEKVALPINAFGVRGLREEFEGYLIHISTDYVFRCLKGAYDEIKIPDVEYNPVNSYGFSKWGGETYLSLYPEFQTTVVRTTGLYGGVSGRWDFAKLVITTLDEKQELNVTKELKGNQTYVPHLAEALLALAESEERPEYLHLASREVVSRYEFALMIASVFGLDKNLLHPVRNTQIENWVARRPKKGGLKVSRAENMSLPIYSIVEGLESFRDGC